MSMVRDSNASNEIVVSSQEVLAMRVIQISADNWAAGNADVVLTVGVQEHRAINLSTETNGMV